MEEAELINQFLRASRESYSTDKVTTVVMGNQSADLDSMASALTFAYYLSNKVDAAIPLINIPRTHFSSRTEVVYLFGELGINTDLLSFKEDIDLDLLNGNGNLRLILVDHNKLERGQDGLHGSLVRILDHHDDKNSYPESCDVDIRPVGSTATLVSELYLKDGREFIDGAIGTLLLGTILLDTVNLDPEKKRGKVEDERAASALLEITGLDRNALFEKLQLEKFNIANLGSYGLLRRDPKVWELDGATFGVSSIYLSINAWMKKDPDLVSSFHTYLKEEKLDGLITMHAIQGQEFTRNLAIYVPDDRLRKTVVAFLKGENLGLERIDGGSLPNGDRVDFYSQKTTTINRKELETLFTKFQVKP